MQSLQTLGLSIYRELQLQEKALQITKGHIPHSLVHLGEIQEYQEPSNLIIQETFAEGMVMCPAVLAHIFGRVSYNPATLEILSCLTNRFDETKAVLCCLEIDPTFVGKPWKSLMMHFMEDESFRVTPIGVNRLFFDETGCEDSYVDGDPGGRLIISMPNQNMKIKACDYVIALADWEYAKDKVVLKPTEEEPD